MESPAIAFVLLTVVALQLKHFISDGPLQTLAMVRAKRHYGRPLGLAHALIHGAGTFVVFGMLTGDVRLGALLAALDLVIHYHIDFAKENVVVQMGWTTQDGPFWWAYAADQTLHQMTYVLLAYLAFTP
jgi:hypothetical protein